MRAAFVTVTLLVSATALAQDPREALVAFQDGDPFAIAATNRLTLSEAHHFAKSEAIERMGYLFGYWKKRFNIVSVWKGDRVFLSGSVYGIKIEAMMAIDDSGVSAFANDPGWPWRGQVVGYVEKKLKKYLHPTYDEP